MEMIEARHAKVTPTLNSEALERHYKERIKTLESQLSTMATRLTAAEMELEQKTMRIKVVEAKADEFAKALAEMTVKAVMGGVK